MQRSRSEHLFQCRFKSFLVEDDAYLLELSYYIHRNPVRAGMVQRLADYRWSSYRQYACKDKALQCLKVETLLSLFSAADKHGAYRIGCQEYAREEKKIWEEVKHGILLGSEDFAEAIRSRFVTAGKTPEELPQQRKLQKKQGLRDLLQQGAAVLSFNIEKAFAC